jgi:ABC-type polysaccharide/polyol phosphate export permease
VTSGRTKDRDAAPVVSSRAHQSVWSYRPLIVNFARRDLQARYKGTLLGFAWSLVVPIATLLTYSLVFGVVFRQDPPLMGNGKKPSFFIFLFSGLVPWGMYSVTLGTSIASLLGNGPLMKKIYFPAYASVFGSVAATFYQSLIEVLALVAVLVIVGNIGLTWLVLVAWFALFALFVGALALMLSVLNVHLRDTAYLVGIVIQLQFYMTPIIYLPSQVPGSKFGIPLRGLIRHQPMAIFIELFRSLIYELRMGRGVAWAMAVFWTALAVAGAAFVYGRRGQDLSEEL